MNQYQAGYALPIKWQSVVPVAQPGVGNVGLALNVGALATLNVKSQTIDEEVGAADVSNTGHAGRTARLACKADHKGTIEADFDADVPPYLTPPNIRAGSKGILLFFVTPTKAIQIPCMVLKVHYASAVQGDGHLAYSFDVGESVDVGTVIYPAT